MKTPTPTEPSRSIDQVEYYVAWVLLIMYLCPPWFTALSPQVIDWINGKHSTLAFLTSGVWLSVLAIIIEMTLINYAIFGPMTRGFKVQNQSNADLLAIQAELAELRSQLALMSSHQVD